MPAKTLKLIPLLLIGVIAFVDFSAAQEKKNQKADLNWVSYDEGLKIAAKNEKLIFVDFYTDWCGYCKKMDRETFANKEVSDYLKKNFVVVKVNAESKTAMELPTGSISGSQLSKSFGVRGYPTYWFLKPNGEKINNISGYSPPNKFIHVLMYVGGGHYETKTFTEFLSDTTASNK